MKSRKAWVDNMVLKSVIFAAALVFIGNSAIADDCLDGMAQVIAENVVVDISNGNKGLIDTDSVSVYIKNNWNECKSFLKDKKTSVSQNSGEFIDTAIDWDAIKADVNEIEMAKGANQRALLVCENNRSFSGGIDAVFTGASVVAAIFSFGSGAVVAAGVKEAAKAGLKQIGTNVGKDKAKQAVGQAAARGAGNRIARNEISEVAVERAARDKADDVLQKAATEKLQKETAKKTADDALAKAQSAYNQSATPETHAALTAAQNAANLASKEFDDVVDAVNSATSALNAANASVLAAETAGLAAAAKTTAIATPVALGLGGLAYSVLNSDVSDDDQEILASGGDIKMYCSDLDTGKGCYRTCDESLLNVDDDLNKKLFQNPQSPLYISGSEGLCVDRETYVMHQIVNGNKGAPFAFNLDKNALLKAKNYIQNNVADSGNCDWSGDDIDMFLVTPAYNPAEFDRNIKYGFVFEKGNHVRLDD